MRGKIQSGYRQVNCKYLISLSTSWKYHHISLQSLRRLINYCNYGIKSHSRPAYNGLFDYSINSLIKLICDRRIGKEPRFKWTLVVCWEKSCFTIFFVVWSVLLLVDSTEINLIKICCIWKILNISFKHGGRFFFQMYLVLNFGLKRPSRSSDYYFDKKSLNKWANF